MNNKTYYAFWYRSKKVLLVPHMKTAYEFLDYGLDWTILYHSADSNFYWEWNHVDAGTVVQGDPRIDADNSEACFEAQENGNVCPYLDQPCIVDTADSIGLPTLISAEDAMCIWLQDTDYRRNWEVIERP